MNGEAMMIIVVAIIIGLIPTIFFLITLQNTLKKVSAKNRTMPPGQVWIQLIPLVGIVWAFVNVIRISDSLHAEFSERGIDVGSARPGFQIGMAYAICFIASNIPILGILAAIGGIVCWIIYWVKIHNYGKLLPDPSRSLNVLDTEEYRR
ncbi:MAG: hypothetical protein HKN32_03760 [Flavobacteriales bacterium]|nr:hypothetical protein [Flavobacteriales bacterium]